MSVDPYHEILERVRQLSPKDQLKLIEAIVSGLQQAIPEQSPPTSGEDEGAGKQKPEEPPVHDLMAYEGFAKDVWKGINVEQYLNEERNSWDG